MPFIKIKKAICNITIDTRQFTIYVYKKFKKSLQ